MKRPCDCCGGARVATSGSTPNAPGLPKLRYRIGAHATFFETMQARLSSTRYPALATLSTRDESDPAIAFLDAWALVGDVLTFYQERIANEGYLRTACHRRSILELGRLVGYTPRPGVASSVYLAYTLDKDAAPVTIPAGALANSVPGPGETQQAFETSDALEVRPAWNAMKPRPTRSQRDQKDLLRGLYLDGTVTKLAVNDPLLVGGPTEGQMPTLYYVHAIAVDNDKKWTVVTLRDTAGVVLQTAAVAAAHASQAGHVAEEFTGTTAAAGAAAVDGSPLDNIVSALTLPPSVQPVDATKLTRSIRTIFSADADTAPRLLASLKPVLSTALYSAWSALKPETPPVITAYALRVEAQPFGHNAALRQTGFNTETKSAILSEWAIDDPWNGSSASPPELAAIATPAPDHHEPTKLFLDNDYDIAPKSYIAIVKNSQAKTIVAVPDDYIHRSFIGYGLSGKTVQVNLSKDKAWLGDNSPFSVVRTTRVYTGSEELTLGQMPIAEDVTGATIELDALYEGLQPGRWLIVEGTRRYNGKNTGVEAAELVMIAAVAQSVLEKAGVPLPGEKVYTVITLATPLAYSYVRDTVAIYGNVVKATNGQTRQETLGAGDAPQSFQTFTLKQSPLTYVSAATTSGAQSTLVSRVNDIQWHETDTLVLLGPKDRKFVTKTDNAAMTSLVFGDGVHGARLPTGVNNVTATYRSGMGKGGNVRPGQISLLSTKPLGVRAVTNPIRASGGADRESRDQARQNVPVALMALDRLVSITDYANFSCAFAGVGKAAARFLPVNGKLQPGQLLPAKQRTVQVIIAGNDDIPIDPASDLYANLYAALRKFGDPYLPIQIAVRDRSALVISANVKIDSDYDWETLEPKIRAAVLQRFSFASVNLGDTLYLADAVATIQAVRGVLYVDIDVFDTISEAKATTSFTERQATTLGLNDRIDAGATSLIYLTPDVPDTLVLQELKL